MKKVFRIWKLVEYRIKLHNITTQGIIDLLKHKWTFEMEGKTIEEIHKLGYMTSSEWLVEEPSYKKVFSVEKFIDYCVTRKLNDVLFNGIVTGWVVKCDGLTNEECSELGYHIEIEEWFVTIEEDEVLEYKY